MITFISAQNKQVVVHSQTAELGGASNAAELAALITKFGMGDSVMFSSTMHFATDGDFDRNEDAQLIWDEAIAALAQ